MAGKQYVYQYNDGTFYVYSGEAVTYVVIHKTESIESARFFDEPKSEYMPRYEGGKWLEVEVSYSSKEYKWPKEPTMYKCDVCSLKSTLEHLEDCKEASTGELECPNCFCTEMKEFKEEKVR